MFAVAWRNHCFFESGALTNHPGNTVVAGTMAALRTPQLADKVTIRAERADAGDLYIQVNDFIPEGEEVGRTVRIIGLLNWVLRQANVSVLTWRLDVAGSLDQSFRGLNVDLYPPLSSRFAQHLWHVMDEDILNCNYVRIEITATVGSEGGSIELDAGALFCGPLWVPTTQDATPLTKEWRWSVIEDGSTQGTEGGQGFERVGGRRRQLSFDVTHMTEAWAIGPNVSNLDCQEVMGEVGETTPCAVFLRTSVDGVLSPYSMSRLGLYGRFFDLGNLVHNAGKWYSWTGVKFRELR